jgi:hypothetical protein
MDVIGYDVAVAVPEPGTLALLATTLLGFGVFGRRRKRSDSSGWQRGRFFFRGTCDRVCAAGALSAAARRGKCPEWVQAVRKRGSINRVDLPWARQPSF